MVRAFFVAIALALGVNAEPPSPPPERPATPVPDSILAVFFQEVGPGSELARVDPLTLERSGRSLRLATGGGWTTALSPDHKTLALSGGLGLATVEVVDVRGMRSLGVVDLNVSGSIALLSWHRGYLFAVVDDPQDRAVFSIDPVGRTVQARHALSGTILHAKEGVPGQVVVLLAPPDGIGPLRLAVVGGKGMASTAIPGFVGGWRTEREGEEVHTREEIPALVVDAAGHRAFAFSDGAVAEVSLRNLKVTHHTLSEPVSLLGRLRNWIEPSAQAKLVEGFSRSGAWIGDGHFAVTGTNYTESEITPAQLTIVDAENWTTHAVAKGGAELAVTKDTLMTFGFHRNQGLRGYDFEGQERFHLLRGQGAWVQMVGGLAYAQIGDGRRLAVIDPARGRKIGEAKLSQPITLIEG